MNNIMLDLETLSTRSNAAILSIGAVKFDEHGIGEEFYQVVDLKSVVDDGAHMEPETIMWWMRQGDEARAQFNETDGSDVDKVLLDFAVQFIGISDRHSYNCKVRVWGNGADFDNVILASAYRAAGITVPWMFYNNRCYRTVKSTYRHIKMERVGTYHNALDDAKSQALHLVDIIQREELVI